MTHTTHKRFPRRCRYRANPAIVMTPMRAALGQPPSSVGRHNVVTHGTCAIRMCFHSRAQLGKCMRLKCYSAIHAKFDEKRAANKKRNKQRYRRTIPLKKRPHWIQLSRLRRQRIGHNSPRIFVHNGFPDGMTRRTHQFRVCAHHCVPACTMAPMVGAFVQPPPIRARKWLVAFLTDTIQPGGHGNPQSGGGGLYSRQNHESGGGRYRTVANCALFSVTQVAQSVSTRGCVALSARA